MHNTHSRVHKVRAIAQGAIRSIALMMVVVGSVMVLNRLVFGILGNGDFTQAWGSWMQIGEWHGMFLGLPLVAVGIAMGVLSVWLARWVVRPAASGCAQCGYETLDEDGRCAECGQR